MEVRQPERSAPLVGRQIVLQTSDVPHDQPDPFAHRHLDPGGKEGVLGHADHDLALGRRGTSDDERAADQETQPCHRRPA